jgi:hypothetical protein
VSSGCGVTMSEAGPNRSFDADTHQQRAPRRAGVRFVHAMNRTNVLCQIDANGCDCHGTSPSSNSA